MTMTDWETIPTPEHVKAWEHDAAPFTQIELMAIAAFEDRANPLMDCVSDLEFTDPARREETEAYIKHSFTWLAEWYEALDTLYSELHESEAGRRFLVHEAKRWYRHLHYARREACRFAFGTAGPVVMVEANYLTFGDVPGLDIGAGIAAEATGTF